MSHCLITCKISLLLFSKIQHWMILRHLFFSKIINILCELINSMHPVGFVGLMKKRCSGIVILRRYFPNWIKSRLSLPNYQDHKYYLVYEINAANKKFWKPSPWVLLQNLQKCIHISTFPPYGRKSWPRTHCHRMNIHRLSRVFYSNFACYIRDD